MIEKLNVKVGDTVVVSGRWGDSVKTVEAITPKGFIRVQGTLYNPNGRQRSGDAWERNRLRHATPERIQAIKDSETIQKAYYAMKNAKGITAEQAEQILQILTEWDAESEGE